VSERLEAVIESLMQYRPYRCLHISISLLPFSFPHCRYRWCIKYFSRIQISFLGIVFDSSHAAIVKAPSIPRRPSDLVGNPKSRPRRRIVGGLHVQASVGYASLPSTFVNPFFSSPNVSKQTFPCYKQFARLSALSAVLIYQLEVTWDWTSPPR
jgi:hypothetical protein